MEILTLGALDIRHLRCFWNNRSHNTAPRGDIQMILAKMNQRKKKFLIIDQRNEYTSARRTVFQYVVSDQNIFDNSNTIDI